MPVIKSAAKALRRDKRRAKTNQPVRSQILGSIKKAKKGSSKKDLMNAYSIIDRAAKKGIIHKNKASRLKSRLTRSINTSK
jgi:small subunit ribosomal protein S20